MGHKRRFYTPLPLKNENLITIQGEEAHHAYKVLRVKENELVSLINGNGETALGTIIKISKDEMEISILKNESPKVFKEPKVKVSLLIGMCEIVSLEEALLHSTELGLWRFCPVWTKFSVTKAEQIERKLERFKKIAISAIKQSGFPFLPEITFFEDLKSALQNLPKKGFLLHQGGETYLSDYVDLKGEITFAIGPEGDFSEEEKNLFSEFGYIKTKLSKNTLRVETAALAAMAQIQKFM